jgi:polyhydroxyalkanoate synthesis regulator phasin
LDDARWNSLGALFETVKQEVNMSLKGAKELSDQPAQRVENRLRKVDLSAKETLRQDLDRMDVPSRSEFNILKLRVDRLERRISSLEIVLTSLKEPVE